MQQVYVKFKDMEQIRDFVNIIDRFDGNFDMGSGRRIVDAKSILGIAALDLTQPQKLHSLWQAWQRASRISLNGQKLRQA